MKWQQQKLQHDTGDQREAKWMILFILAGHQLEWIVQDLSCICTWGVRCECYISPYKICIRCRPCQIWLDTPWNWSRNFMIQRITFRNVLKSQIQKNLLWLADYLDTMCRRSDLSSWTTIDGQDLICSNSLQAVKCNYIEPFTLTLILSLAFHTHTHTYSHYLTLFLTFS